MPAHKEIYTHAHTQMYTYIYIYIYIIYILKRDKFIAEWFIMAKNIGDKVNAYLLENGGIKNGIFTSWNIMKPFKRIIEYSDGLGGTSKR